MPKVNQIFPPLISDLRAKRELVDIKQQRLHLAQDEYNHLNTTLSALSASTTSCKSTSANIHLGTLINVTAHCGKILLHNELR